jgi:WD40 repeat protein
MSTRGWASRVRAWSAGFGAAVAALVVACAGYAEGGKTDGLELLSFVDTSTDITRAADASAGDLTAAPGTVLALAVSPDGSTLAIGGENPSILLRDARTNRLRAILTARAEPVICLAFSPDGKTLASGGFDRLIKLWDVATLSERATLLGHEGWVNALAFAPDGQTLASAGQDQSVRLWETADGRAIATLPGHVGPVRSVAFTPDGETLASAGADRVVRLWDVASRTPTGAFSGHRGTIRALAYSPDGKTLASASEDHAVKLWDTAAGKARATLPGHTDQINALAFSPRGSGLATAGYDSAIRLWDVAGHAEPLDVLRGHAEGITALAFNPSTGALASAGFDKTVKLWTPAARFGVLKRSIRPATGRAANAVFAPDGKTLATYAPGELVVRLWDTSTWTERGSIERNDAGVVDVRYSPNGERIAITNANRMVRIVDAATHEELGRLGQAPTGRSRFTPLFAFAPDGVSMAVAESSQEDSWSVSIWSIPRTKLDSATDVPRPGKPETFKPRQILISAQPSSMQGMALSPDGTRMAIASIDLREAKFWLTLHDVADGRELVRQAVQGPGLISPLVFSADGKFIAAVIVVRAPGEERILQVWDAASLLKRGTPSLRGSGRATLAFSPDGATIAMGTSDGSAQFWDSGTFRPRGSIKAHDGLVTSISFAPDGKTFATASTADNETAKIWELRQDPSAFPWRGSAVLAASFSADGKTLALGGDAGTLRLADPATRRVSRTLTGHKYRIWSIAFAPDGKTLVSAGGDWERHDDTGELRVFDLISGVSKSLFPETHKLIFTVAIAPDGRTLATGGWGSDVTLWDLAKGTVTQTLSGHTDSVRRLAFSPDGRTLASGSFDGSVRLWDLSRGTPAQVKRVVNAHAGGVNGLAFSPDGLSLVTGGKSTGRPIDPGAGELTLWDLNTGKERYRRAGVVKGNLLSVAFSPDGRTIASGGGDFDKFAELKLWDAATGSVREDLSGHEQWVEAVAFARDGRLASAGGVSGRPGEVRVWELNRKP